MNFEKLTDTPPWEWPDNADQTILKILQNPSSKTEERELAAEMAGDSVIVNKALIEALIHIIRTKEETEGLRSACVMALGPVLELLDMGELDDQPEVRDCALLIPDTLRALHSDEKAPTILRRRALETSVRFDQDWHSDAITTALNNGDAGFQRTAVFAMRFVSGFENEILDALKSEDADTEFQAVCAADVWQIDEAWKHVLDLVQNSETEKFLRMAALEAVASIRTEEAAEIIAELGEFEDEEMKELVQEILTAIDGL